MIYKPNFFVITGGPGVGKTTLLEALAKQGFPYVPEVAREIIREQASRNGDALPWVNIPAYTHPCFPAPWNPSNSTKNRNLFFSSTGVSPTPSLTYTSPINPHLPNSNMPFKISATIRRYSFFPLGPRSTKPIPNANKPTKKPSKPTMLCSSPTNNLITRP